MCTVKTDTNKFGIIDFWEALRECIQFTFRLNNSNFRVAKATVGRHPFFIWIVTF